MSFHSKNAVTQRPYVLLLSGAEELNALYQIIEAGINALHELNDAEDRVTTQVYEMHSAYRHDIYKYLEEKRNASTSHTG